MKKNYYFFKNIFFVLMMCNGSCYLLVYVGFYTYHVFLIINIPIYYKIRGVVLKKRKKEAVSFSHFL